MQFQQSIVPICSNESHWIIVCIICMGTLLLDGFVGALKSIEISYNSSIKKITYNSWNNIYFQGGPPFKDNIMWVKEL